MDDDFGKFRKLKTNPGQTTENVIGVKQNIDARPKARLCFVITKNKNNSWVDDLYVQEQLNRLDRVFH